MHPGVGTGGLRVCTHGLPVLLLPQLVLVALDTAWWTRPRLRMVVIAQGMSFMTCVCVFTGLVFVRQLLLYCPPQLSMSVLLCAWVWVFCWSVG